MACIGHICVQWALLENNLLGLTGIISNMPIEEAYIVFGGLDMRPRLNMAVNLSRHHKLHPPLLKRLLAVRDAVSKNKIDEKRNRAIHGVHQISEKPLHVSLTMARWSGDKRTTDVSIADLHKSGFDILDLAQEVWAIIQAYGIWKFGEHRPENTVSQFVKASPSLWLKIKQYARTRINHLRGNL